MTAVSNEPDTIQALDFKPPCEHLDQLADPTSRCPAPAELILYWHPRLPCGCTPPQAVALVCRPHHDEFMPTIVDCIQCGAGFAFRHAIARVEAL